MTARTALELRLPVDRGTLSLVRREVRELEARGLSDDCVQTAVLLASEIATNAIRHGGVEDVLQVAIEYRDGLLRVSVRQPNAFERHADQTEGWGLTLLDRLADTWTTELLDDGWTKVTFELTEIGGRKV